MRKSTTRSKKPAATKKPGTKVARGNSFSKNSRLQKYDTKIARLGNGGKLSPKQISSLTAEVTISALKPTQVIGQIISSDDNGVVIRQARSSGSSKPVVKHYLNSEILMKMEDKGRCILSVMMMSTEMKLKRASVVFKGDVAVITDNDSGDTFEVNRTLPHTDVQIEVLAD